MADVGAHARPSSVASLGPAGSRSASSASGASGGAGAARAGGRGSRGAVVTQWETAQPLLPSPQREFARLRAEYRDQETAAAERDAIDGVALHDARLLRLNLAGNLQRYRERPPTPEEVAERYEAEVDELVREVLALRDERGALTAAEPEADEATDRAAGSEAERRSVAPRTACEELSDEVRQLWWRRVEHRRTGRQASLEEWHLGCLRGEARRVMRELKQRDQQLEELRQRHSRAANYLQEAVEAQAQRVRQLERERTVIRDLHAQASGLREACYMPAKMKRESSFLIRMLDQEGGRLNTRRHLQGLKLCKRLYDDVAAKAPSLLPAAGGARSQMEAEFTRYLALEESHGRALQRVHLAVTRGLLQGDVGGI